MSVTRRLAAILAADVVGYSRLMEQDEAGTLAALKVRRKGVLEPLVTKHQGRVFKIAGDGVLVEFASAVNAVQCAIELQAGFGADNSDLPEDRRIVLRIGVHVGDVMVEGSDLYGDGVNIAARLEAMADPGGILVSEDVHRQVRNKLETGFEDIGPQALKNVTEPIRVFRVVVAGVAPSGVHVAKRSGGEKPSIAVLPFTNMSGDPEQNYFSDGITEDIITDLSRFKSQSVVARNTSFQYRGKSVDVAQIGKQLGARYVVEGSVRKLGERVRITAQLIDAATGKHLWAERFDRDMSDLFAVQDEVVKAIVYSIYERVEDSEILHRSRVPSKEWTAYDFLLSAKEKMSYGEPWMPTEGDLRRAIELDPMIPDARSLLVHALIEKYCVEGKPEHLDEALELAASAIALNPTGSGPQVAMACLSCYLRRFELAGAHFDRAIEFNPNNAPAWITRAQWLVWLGKCGEAMEMLDRTPPFGQFMEGYFWETRAQALFQLRRYQEVIDISGRLVKMDVPLWSHAIAAFAHAGRLEEASRKLAELLAARPYASVERAGRWAPYLQPAMRDHLLDGLRKAGLPE